MQLLELLTIFIVSIPAAVIVAIASLSQTPNPSTQAQNIKSSSVENKTNTILRALEVKNIPIPTITPTPLPTRVPTKPQIQEPSPSQKSPDNLEWGVAKQIDEHTYTIKVNYDSAMSNGHEILSALNVYIRNNGKGELSWDQRLADYAQQRADTFKSISNTDSHAGFENFLNNEDGFGKLGFNRLGENSYYGGQLTGTHLIEWVFAQSPGHNANQLDSWSHVGIGVNSNAVNLNFGGN